MKTDRLLDFRPRYLAWQWLTCVVFQSLWSISFGRVCSGPVLGSLILLSNVLLLHQRRSTHKAEAWRIWRAIQSMGDWPARRNLRFKVTNCEESHNYFESHMLWCLNKISIFKILKLTFVFTYGNMQIVQSWKLGNEFKILFHFPLQTYISKIKPTVWVFLASF